MDAGNDEAEVAKALPQFMTQRQGRIRIFIPAVDTTGTERVKVAPQG
jgi:hypothetical protein